MGGKNEQSLRDLSDYNKRSIICIIGFLRGVEEKDNKEKRFFETQKQPHHTQYEIDLWIAL